MGLATDFNEALAEAQQTLSTRFPNTAVRLLVMGTLMAGASWLTAGLLCIAILALAMALGISSLCLFGIGTFLLLAACIAGAWACMLAWATACTYATVAVLTWIYGQASGLQSFWPATSPSTAPTAAGGERSPKALTNQQHPDVYASRQYLQRRAASAAASKQGTGTADDAVAGTDEMLGASAPASKGGAESVRAGSQSSCTEPAQPSASICVEAAQQQLQSSRTEAAEPLECSCVDQLSIHSHASAAAFSEQPGEGGLVGDASCPGLAEDDASTALMVGKSVPAGDASAAVMLAKARKQHRPLPQQSCPGNAGGMRGKAQGTVDANLSFQELAPAMRL